MSHQQENGVVIGRRQNDVYLQDHIDANPFADSTIVGCALQKN
jgi:hypothetical protein